MNFIVEIIKEFGINVEVWIDGKVSDLGCIRGENIKKSWFFIDVKIFYCFFINLLNYFFRCLLLYKIGIYMGRD